MADTPEEHEKTEDPTQKRLDDARKKGDVAKSQEVNSWFIMLAMTAFIVFLSKGLISDLGTLLRGILANSHAIPLDNGGLRVLFKTLSYKVLVAMSFTFLLIMIAGVTGNLIQHGLIFTNEQIIPKLSKISPLAGLKRLFSMQTVMNFVKSMIKLVLVTVVIIVIVWPKQDGLDALIHLDPRVLLKVTHELSTQIMIGVLILFTLLAGLDYWYQQQVWWNKQKMTLKEVRDEYKQMEGDPQVKAKIRQIRMERGRKRMLANVPDASVVITNPTHFSVALKYEAGMAAPICLAKGADNIAFKIRQVAKEHDIPLVENPPLARALYATVEVDDEIPEEHYKAVAEVIGYVMRLRQKASRR